MTSQGQTNMITPIIVARLAMLEEKVELLSKSIEKLSCQAPLKTASIKTLFVSPEKQGKAYLGACLTPKDLKRVRSNKRDASLVELKRKVISKLYANGLSVNDIAKLTNKHYSSITYHLAMLDTTRPTKAKQYIERRKRLDTRRTNAIRLQREEESRACKAYEQIKIIGGR